MGPTSRYCRQGLIHKAGVSAGTKGEAGGSALISIRALNYRGPSAAELGGGILWNHTEAQQRFHVVWLLHNGLDCLLLNLYKLSFPTTYSLYSFVHHLSFCIKVFMFSVSLPCAGKRYILRLSLCLEGAEARDDGNRLRRQTQTS